MFASSCEWTHVTRAHAAIASLCPEYAGVSFREPGSSALVPSSPTLSRRHARARVFNISAPGVSATAVAKPKAAPPDANSREAPRQAVFEQEGCKSICAAPTEPAGGMTEMPASFWYRK
jgi:hypothetical protein